jgi:endonuclease G
MEEIIMQSIDNILADPKIKADVFNLVDSRDLSARLNFNPEEVRDSLKREDLETTTPNNQIGTEAIVLLVGRPVLQVINNTYEVPLSSEWQRRLNENRSNIEKAIPSVGRIEVKNHPDFNWLGTGWLVEKQVVVTNRHVANLFAKKTQAQTLEFRQNFRNELMAARIDIREEFLQPEEIEFKVEKVLFISEEDGLDIAFLKVKSRSRDDNLPLPMPIKLAKSDPSSGTNVVVIGYPAKDSRSDFAEMERIFGSIYDVKRLAPGQIFATGQPGILKHDCSTLGGNSGSVVLDISTGEAVGLHFAGKHREGNFAVSAAKVREALSSL